MKIRMLILLFCWNLQQLKAFGFQKSHNGIFFMIRWWIFWMVFKLIYSYVFLYIYIPRIMIPAFVKNKKLKKETQFKPIVSQYQDQDEMKQMLTSSSVLAASFLNKTIFYYTFVRMLFSHLKFKSFLGASFCISSFFSYLFLFSSLYFLFFYLMQYNLRVSFFLQVK